MHRNKPISGARTLGSPTYRVAAAVVGVALLIGATWSAAAVLPDEPVLRSWVEDMKRSERGPFQHIRWFCKDGTVLPPSPYACANHGGGVQHGEWTDRVKQLRAAGYRVANVLAGIDAQAFAASVDSLDALNQIVIERFMVAADDGWIFRRARYYRGSLQEEGERRGARRLLLKLAEDGSWLRHRYLPLRTAVRLLDHGEETQSLTEIRQLAAMLSERDPSFMPLRNKIHAAPDRSDAEAVRAHASRHEGSGPSQQYHRLANLIDSVYAGVSAVRRLQDLAKRTSGVVAERFAQSARALAEANGHEEIFTRSASLLSEFRSRAAELSQPSLRLAVLGASIALENDHYVAATTLREAAAGATRMRQIDWLKSSVMAIYGTGLISRRQFDELQRAIDRVGQDPVASLDTYKGVLDYLSRVPAWSSQWQRFYFHEAMRRFLVIEPRAALFLQDQLRASPLSFLGHVIDGLLQDANAMAGMRHELFGVSIGAGLRGLNPGLARGRLLLSAPEPGQGFDPAGIYLLAETVSELPPVAGILTLGEGNPLSHVQLLARNLGIPNVAVDESLVPRLRSWQARQVVLAVSARGSVRLVDAQSVPARVFGDPSAESTTWIRPDLHKLDLGQTELVPLHALRAADSGRIVGPKAAQLGQLRHQFPTAVADGLAVPFGVFRELLLQPFHDTGMSALEWLRSQYRSLETLPRGSELRAGAAEALRHRLHSWIENADPGSEFRDRLRPAMARTFGADGSYGVYVRSDTNVEDLPGFTGAGLNLTVPNVVGFDKVLAAISRVWASPFLPRAFAWRQSRMHAPEHVYPAVLLLRSVPVEKSGVLVTQDVDTGDRTWLSIAVNEGVGGAVDGQAAESLRVHRRTGEVRLLAQATATVRRVIDPRGGLVAVPVSGRDHVLTANEIELLIAFVDALPQQYPLVADTDGQPAPVDIEFGFLDGRLVLFQLRPFAENKVARINDYLRGLDRDMRRLDQLQVELGQIPGRTT